ncbi:unnamed protein product [Microthlaspi erraticum]|uniref:RBR-type E3 ubiquitin transferase n=1 Tax=Microthlaspi erraticum TaxID=1685480 RepID=A0A6D2KMK6_9BRAS|nr:unnamed protein product [Microthlaspi erraticum]
MTSSMEPCVICLEDIDFHLMFSVDKCGHRFCRNCVKRHIETKLLEGTIPNCPQYRCKSKLSIDRCDRILAAKPSLMYKQRMKEVFTPMRERVFCPYPSCSHLMSKTELSSTSSCESGLRICSKCSGSFCVHCNVPWHSGLSCTDYNKSSLDKKNYDPRYDAKLMKFMEKTYGWRQCVKCHHMIERSSGCARITCRYVTYLFSFRTG